MAWELIYYETQRGRIPVKEFLNGLTPGQRESLRALMQLLEEFGTGLHHSFPKRVKHLKGTGTLWELREYVERMQLRIVYSPWKEGKFVMLHGFVKDQKSEPSEIAQAGRYWNDWLGRDHDQPGVRRSDELP